MLIIGATAYCNVGRMLSRPLKPVNGRLHKVASAWWLHRDIRYQDLPSIESQQH